MITTEQPTASPENQPAANGQRATAFTAFWLFQASPDRPMLEEADRQRLGQTMIDAITRASGTVQLRGAYATTGLSAGVDLMLWLVADDCTSLQRLARDIHVTKAGRALALRHVYLGVASMSQYDASHSPAFMRGEAPRAYLSIYPFTKTPEWYLLSYEERRALMIEHGEMGREYPSILTNTVNSFGIADQEFIVALEDDDPATLVKMVQRLRAAEVRKYTASDTPIFLGRLTNLPDAIIGAL